ncbi:nitrate reductase [Defluviimonas sp. 20V17]|uniref:nitrate reductase (quinone) n=1 Tax=Allgaiera indica TaxID=765699 RepID=A0AAN4ZYZ9_9RHOB|nr:respiratory nitrate reductase subunit gamma [Allgaiera indica]KDB03082.1 nitrate reductase [Defluviimonas sp. 20V17]GHE00823.1 nitrate reductase subunit gamma [Allgaiera indica]SDW72319.1 respiratory nitrate reductase gamma subunit [Allgaiera indica]
MNNFFFGIYPYIALSVLIIGSIARYERDPFSWKSSSSQLLRRRQLRIGSVLFHVGILTIFFGHLVGLFAPLPLLHALGISHEFKQILAMVVGGLAGIAALIGGGMLFHRRWTDPRIRKTSSVADIGILVLILIQLVFGLSTIVSSAQHLDGKEMVKFMLWAQGVVTFQPDVAARIADTPLIFKLHIVLGLTIFLLFPFTRLVHMLSVPLRYFWRPGYQIVRSRRTQPLPQHSDAELNQARLTAARRAAAQPTAAE